MSSTSASSSSGGGDHRSAQIRQMVNFILQEAHEKSVEINIKAQHDFDLERQKIFIEGIKKIDEEFIQMAKEKEISARIEKSTEIGNARTKKMTERQNLLDILQGEATTDLASISTSKDYPKLIENLITQGLIKIEEKKVSIICRPKDKSTVEAAVPKAISAATAALAEAGFPYDADVTVVENASVLPDGRAGGVILTSLGGKIVCDQTLETRLRYVYDDLQPQIRDMLFGN